MKQTWKLLLKEIKQDNIWGQPVDSVKLGKVAVNFKGKTDDTEFDLKKGDEVYYQNGALIKIEGEDYQLVSLTSLICPK